MEEFVIKVCKYCALKIEDIVSEGLKCSECKKYVHLTCLKRGSTPGALAGDVFFVFTCLECNKFDNNASETFQRGSQKWFNVLVLTFYHLNATNKAISRDGYFHWRMHVTAFIDKNWHVIFDRHFKQKKNWMGTISGLLSLNSSTFFTKASHLPEQGWWALSYPKLTPNVVVGLANDLNSTKFNLRATGKPICDADFLHNMLISKNYPSEFLQRMCDIASTSVSSPQPLQFLPKGKSDSVRLLKNKRSYLPSIESLSTKSSDSLDGTRPCKRSKSVTELSSSQDSSDSSKDVELVSMPAATKLHDPFCHYNTSLNKIFMLKRMNLRTKLLGGLREETILSSYTNLYLKPYIYRDTVNVSQWLKLMAQVQLKANCSVKNYELPPRAPIDYVYVQPAHIPAINSLCNQFFWPGIDLTDTLQCPDFTCVVMYKKLIIGFAFIVPDTKVHENYVSFIFVRPGWRNIGIGRFMMYHLIQTSMGKDITLHVGINNPALLLYQQFGFKVEHVELNFYDKYLQCDSAESKHAFFCRLER